MLTHCIRCGVEAALTVRIEDWDTLLCPECGEEFTLDDVQERIGQMNALIRCCKAAQAALESVTA